MIVMAEHLKIKKKELNFCLSCIRGILNNMVDIINTKTIGFDGEDKIIYSESFNVYEDELTIPSFLDYKFKFIFENTAPNEGQNDINFKWSGSEALVTISKKFRNNLGTGVTEKLPILQTHDSKKILFSIFGQQVGGSKLIHVTINFYER